GPFFYTSCSSLGPIRHDICHSRTVKLNFRPSAARGKSFLNARRAGSRPDKGPGTASSRVLQDRGRLLWMLWMLLNPVVVASRMALVAAGLIAALPSQAQNRSYPVKPVIVVVPAPRGGGTDTFARELA